MCPQRSIGRAIIDLSDSKPSTATLLKNIGNVFIVGMIETVAEGHVLAEKTGLSVENLQKFISAVLPGPYMIYSNRMSSGDYYMKEVQCLQTFPPRAPLHALEC